jgi:diguanylate cyclase (GGDEF)-like protein
MRCDRLSDSGLAIPGIVGLCYWLAAASSLWLTAGADGVASLWPASGVLLGAVIRTEGRVRVACILMAAFASLVANVGAGMTAWVSIGFTVANVAEAIVGGWAWSRLANGRRELTSWADVVRLSVAVAAAACVSGLLAAITIGTPSPIFVVSWVCTVALGMLLVAPVVMTDERFLEAETGGSTRTDRLVWLGALAAVTVGSFVQVGYPLLFLPMALLLGVTWHVGLRGTAIGVLLISIVGSMCTGLGRGPIALIDAAVESRSLFLQGYLLVLFATALPLAVISSSKARLTGRLTIAVREAELAARQSLELVDRDALTGVASRRRVLRELEWSAQTAAASGSPLSVVLIDIDHFKEINDHFGHAEGDAVLTSFATVIASAVHFDDLVGRIGGEEFLVVTRQDVAGSVALAERLRQAVLASPLSDICINVTASFGVAGHAVDEKVGDLLRRADTALYRAKAMGRNVVRSADDRLS